MLWRPISLVTLFPLLSLHLQVVAGGPVQKIGLTVPDRYRPLKDEVGNMFVESYVAYQEFARGHDNLSPVSKQYSDPRNGWGATVVDAMSTMYIMGLQSEFDQSVEFVKKINFQTSRTPDKVSVFESTIRYVGGLLSAYELSGKTHDVLLSKAHELADKLVYAWPIINERVTKIPYTKVDFNTNLPQQGISNIAEAGTLTLEFSTLSKYTGNDRYRSLAVNAATHIAGLPAPLPGLPAQGIDPSTGSPVGAYVTWGGGSDSYFEYLIKYARLSNTDDPIFVNNWLTAVDSSIKTLFKRSTVGAHAYLADFNDDRKIVHIGSHLACFHGGNWILGGKLLDNDTIVNYGLELTDGCWNTYAGTSTGIGPEVFGYVSSEGDFNGQGSPDADQHAFYNKHGFYITRSYYVLRPEVLESNFYAWRATGDVKYLERAKQAIGDFKKYLKTPSGGYAGVWDVDNVVSDRVDDQESFWFAEVLKYLYLTFDDPNRYSLDDYVFNTEAHPFRAPPAKASYGGQVVPGLPLVPTPTQGLPLPVVSPLPLISPIPSILPRL